MSELYEIKENSALQEITGWNMPEIELISGAYIRLRLSFGKSFMKIRSAVPENGCLILMHYRVTDGKKCKRQKKTSVKHTRIRAR